MGRQILLLSQRTGNRFLIAAASPEARALGLQPGMAVSQARALVPGLDVRDHDPAADVDVLTRLALFAARRWTPRAAVSPPDGLFLDLGGVAHLFGGEEAMCRRIVRFCERAGFAARIAVAGTPGAAHALARFGGGGLCPAGGEPEALAPLPLAALRVEEPVLAAARRLGLETVGDLLPLPRGPLQRRFGKTLLARLDQALGRSGEAIEPVVPEEAPCAVLRFAEPIATAEAIAEALRLLMGRLIAQLREKGLAARSLALLCDRVDGRVERIAIGTARATRDGAHLLRLLSMKIETIEPGFGLDEMRLVAGRCEPLGAEAIVGETGGDAPISPCSSTASPAASAPAASTAPPPSKATFRSEASPAPARSTPPSPGPNGRAPSACCRRPSGSRMSSPCFPTSRPAASPGAAEPIASPGPTAPSGSTANGGSRPPRPRRCATISRSRTRRGRGSGSTAGAMASMAGRAISAGTCTGCSEGECDSRRS
jgi:protein ImuB